MLLGRITPNVVPRHYLCIPVNDMKEAFDDHTFHTGREMAFLGGRYMTRN